VHGQRGEGAWCMDPALHPSSAPALLQETETENIPASSFYKPCLVLSDIAWEMQSPSQTESFRCQWQLLGDAALLRDLNYAEHTSELLRNALELRTTAAEHTRRKAATLGRPYKSNAHGQYYTSIHAPHADIAVHLGDAVYIKIGRDQREHVGLVSRIVVDKKQQTRLGVRWFWRKTDTATLARTNRHSGCILNKDDIFIQDGGNMDPVPLEAVYGRAQVVSGTEPLREGQLRCNFKISNAGTESEQLAKIHFATHMHGLQSWSMRICNQCKQTHPIITSTLCPACDV
jgi:hypothetical protein